MKHTTGVLTLTVLLAAGLVAAASDPPDEPQRWTGRIAALSGPAAGGTAFLTIQVDHFATDAEIQNLARTLAEDGEAALLEAVKDTEPGGWFKIGTGLRDRLRIIQSMDTPEGRVLVGITDRPIQFGEVARGTRSLEYTFGWIQITFDEDGKGEGTLISAAKVNFDDDGRLVVEGYGIEPLRIFKVKAVDLK